MVTSDAIMFVLTQQVYARPWVRAVSYQVAQTPDFVEAAVGLGISKDCLKGFQVAVNVGKDKGPQIDFTLSIAVVGIIMHGMKVSELGEFGLIDTLADLINAEAPDSARVDRAHGYKLLIGIGDDTAAWKSPPSATELFTTDTMVQGVHFVSGKITWNELGWKALAVNYSDIAAMGGIPRYSIVTLGLPAETFVEDIVQMYRGMLELCREYSGAIVGGDVVSSPVLFITVALVGYCDGAPMTRSSAVAGDQVAVTGHLGSSAGGLRMLLENLSFKEETASFLRAAHNKPRPCIKEGQILLNLGVKSAMDVSDGLMDDLSKLCKASKVSAVVNSSKVPAHESLKQAFPQDWLELALGGGEDYELLFTAPRKVIDKVIKGLPGKVAVIGEIVAGRAGEVKVVDEQGRAVSLAKGGWDHFR